MTEFDAPVIEPLEGRHNRTTFSCGLPELDRYLTRQASQDVQRCVARVFVCTAGDTDAVLGFCTLSPLSIDLSTLPEKLSRKLPRHPVPCALIGRLAVGRLVQGQGLGRILLVDAVKRVATAGETVAIHALIVDAANDDAKRFNEEFGFSALADDPMRPFLPLGHAAPARGERIGFVQGVTLVEPEPTIHSSLPTADVSSGPVTVRESAFSQATSSRQCPCPGGVMSDVPTQCSEPTPPSKGKKKVVHFMHRPGLAVDKSDFLGFPDMHGRVLAADLIRPR